MTIEGDFCDYTDFNLAIYAYAQPQEGEPSQKVETQAIYVRAVIKETTHNNPSFANNAALSPRAAPSERKASAVFNKAVGCAALQSCSNVDAEIDFTWKWGGPSSPSFEVGGSAGVRDGKGYHVEATFSRQDDGTNSLNISGGHDDNGQDLGRSCDNYHGSNR